MAQCHAAVPQRPGVGWPGLGTLVQRGTIVLAQVFDAAMMIDAAEAYSVDVLIGVPAMLKAILARPDLAGRDFSALKIIVSGGDAVPPEVVDACEKTFGVGFSTVYGQTELSPIVCQTSPDDTAEDNRHTAGRPAVERRGCHRRSGNPGRAAHRRRRRDLCPRLPAHARLPRAGRGDDPRTIDEDGWLHTGDLGTLDERGYLTVTGRLKDLIIRGGENIYPRELEEVLRTHPAIDNAVVLGIPDERWGERVVAVIRMTDDATQAPTSADLHDYMRTLLAPHKTPVEWYVSESLPTNAMGKLQKYLLRDQIVSGDLNTLTP